MASNISSIMFKKLKEFLIGDKNKDISVAEAKKIQSATYMLSQTEVKKHFSPIYLTIAQDLDNPEKQVYEAALYYLVKMAKNKPQYQKEIREILCCKLGNKKCNQELKELININLRDI